VTTSETGSKRTLVIKAPRLFNGAGVEYRDGASVWVEGRRIKAVYGPQAPPPPPGAQVLDFPEGCILPGLMDCHVHLMYGTADRMRGPKSYHHVNEADSDALMLLRTVRNGYLHLLKAGVTTMREAGARGRIAFDLKAGISAGLFRGFPSVYACGRTITITGGHFYFCGEEADGPGGCRLAVRRLVKEGADFIKAMSSGGGTYITDNRRASFTVEELKAIVDEAHRHGKATTTHAIATQSIANALEAGMDCIEHFEFVELDYSRRFDRGLGERMVESGVWLSPTIQTGYRGLERLRRLKEERPLTPVEEENLAYAAWKQGGQLYTTGKLYEMGARRFLMGTDAISEFGDYAIGLELMVDAGLTNQDALLAATRNCAEAFGILDDVGTLEPGKVADITVVQGDPLRDIRAMGQVVQVVKGGYVLPMAGLELFPHGPGATQVQRRRRRPDPQVIRLPEDITPERMAS
jgi:imidazolonepropionase-like amidohydrolase